MKKTVGRKGVEHTENLSRLARIEGQVRGIRRMMEDGAYCVDIILQIQAVRAALASVGHRVLEKHMEHCVSGAFTSTNAEEKQDKIRELMQIVKRGGM